MGWSPTSMVEGWQAPVALQSRSLMLEQVEKVIEVIRPAIQADGGDIALVEVDAESGLVLVELSGACVECPASDQTLKAGIERIMKDRVPGVTEVRNVGEESLEVGTAVSL